MTCPHHVDAGAYLLAALPPAERSAFAAHLPACPDCRTAVGELAELPGLLSRVPEPTGAPGRITDPPPAVLLGLLDEVARRRSNRLLLTACAAVVTVLAFLGVAVLAFDDDGQDAGGGSAPTRTVAMQPVLSGDVLRASLDLTTRPWGTEIRLHCSYYGYQGSPVYVLTGQAGEENRELARWSAQAGEEVRLSAATDARDFESFEIRTVSGRVLMRGGP